MASAVTDKDFDSVVLQSSIPVLVDFWAPWCGPCRAMTPVIEELSTEYKGKAAIVKMDVDVNPSTPGKYGIRAVPTLILFKNGTVVDQITGVRTKENLKELIDKVL